MEESEYDEEKKVNITSQPIFWVAMALVVFNAFLYLWSVNRDSKTDESVEPAMEQVENSTTEN